MHIVELRTKNFMRLHVVAIKPDGNVVEISGRNEQGKTSLLTSIVAALGGKRHHPPMPIRQGATSAEIVLDLGDLQITQTWTRKGSYLTVTMNGEEQKRPQQILDELVGRLTFDPLAFANMAPAEHVATVKEVAGLDFTELDRERQEKYEQRTQVNRDYKAERARLEGMPQPPTYPDEPAEEIDIADLLEQRAVREEMAAENNRQRQQLRDAEQKVHQATTYRDDADRRVEELEEQLRLAKEHAQTAASQLATAADEARRIRDRVCQLEDPDLSAIDAKLSQADAHNRRVRDARQRIHDIEQMQERRIDKEKEVDGLRYERDQLTEAIEAIDERKQRMIAEARLPIGGLSLTEEGVTYHGIPFAQCSMAQRIKVSAAMAIAMNPRLRIMLIRNGNDLDRSNRQLLAEMAQKHNMQVWIEMVESDNPAAVVIEDGRVAGVEQVQEVAE